MINSKKLSREIVQKNHVQYKTAGC